MFSVFRHVLICYRVLCVYMYICSSLLVNGKNQNKHHTVAAPPSPFLVCLTLNTDNIYLFLILQLYVPWSHNDLRRRCMHCHQPQYSVAWITISYFILIFLGRQTLSRTGFVFVILMFNNDMYFCYWDVLIARLYLSDSFPKWHENRRTTRTEINFVFDQRENNDN